MINALTAEYYAKLGKNMPPRTRRSAVKGKSIATDFANISPPHGKESQKWIDGNILEATVDECTLDMAGPVFTKGLS